MYHWIAKLTESKQRLGAVRRLIGLLPDRFICFLGWFVGWILYLKAKPLGIHVALNMAEILDSRGQREISRCCRKYFCQFPTILLEVILAPQILKKDKVGQWIIEGEEFLKEALNLGRGAIVFAPHMGNFFYYYWYLSQRYPCLTVATGGSSELRPLYLLFQEMGCQGMDYDNTPPLELLKTLTGHLKNNGVVFLLGDFWRPSFPTAQFFGKPSRSPGGAAALALGHKVPVVPLYGWREKGGRHHLVFEAPIHLYKNFEVNQREAATNLLNVFIEQAIRKVPEQWFYWFNLHERWEPEREQNQTGGAGVA
ncbi:MAG: lysophospholipid acyltransferase family protein [Bacillota bacterium]